MEPKLVRKICSDCKQPYTEELDYNKSSSDTCDGCFSRILQESISSLVAKQSELIPPIEKPIVANFKRAYNIFFKEKRAQRGTLADAIDLLKTVKGVEDLLEAADIVEQNGIRPEDIDIAIKMYESDPGTTNAYIQKAIIDLENIQQRRGIKASFLRIAQLPNKLYHSGPTGLEKLSPGMLGTGHTLEGDWAQKVYKTWPIFLSFNSGEYSGENYEINSSQLNSNLIVADLPSLVDSGMYIDEGSGWWEDGQEPEALKPYLKDGEIPFVKLLKLWPITSQITGSIAYLGEIALKSKTASFIKEAFSYSSTQINLPEDLSKKIIEWGDKFIPEEEIFNGDDGDYDLGREKRPHVTVKYGLHTVDSKEVEEIIKENGEVSISLGNVSIFEPEDKEYDVVKIDVNSEDLHKLNAKVSTLENSDTHPEYKPHVTIAYVKRGNGQKYIGVEVFKGLSFKSDKIDFSAKTEDGKDNKHTTLSL